MMPTTRKRKTNKAKIIIPVLLCIAVLIGVYCLFQSGFFTRLFDKSGWNDKGQYLDYDGNPLTQWQEIEGKRYYFSPKDGTMVTGLETIDGRQYYFGQDGVVATGWVQLDGNKIYLSEDGAVQTGWQNIDGKRYYFTSDGFMATAEVVIDGVRHRFLEDGTAFSGWYEDEKGKCFFGEDGSLQTGWLDYEQKRYYLKDDGSVATGWLNIGEDRYYFLPSGRMAIGEVEVDGISRFFTSTGKEVLLCNPWHAVPDDFEVDLVKIEGKKIDKDAQEPLQQMMNACRDAGLRCVINNSYRSRQWQQNRWDLRISQRMAEGMTKEQAEARTGRSLAIPGHSEHQTGLAVDIIGTQKMYAWLEENCWDYGFILRYPADRIDITGIIHEPWHFRYVGTELSKELQQLGLCMEEYMTKLTNEQKEIKD